MRLAISILALLLTGEPAPGPPRPELLLQNAHSDRVRAVAFSPDGRVLASGGDDRMVKLWDASSGALLRTLPGHDDRVECLVFSPDGSILASGGADRTLRIWRFARGKLLRTVKTEGAVRALAFSPNGKLLAFASDSNLYLLDLPGPGAERILGEKTQERVWIHALAFSPDGRWLASGGEGEQVRLWDPTSGKIVRELSPGGGVVRSLSFHPQGATLAAAVDGKAKLGPAEPGSVVIWETGSGRLLHRLTGHPRWVLAVAYSPDGQRLASAGEDKLIRLWDAATGAQLRALEGHKGRLGWAYSLAFSPDGATLASAGEDNTVKLWRASDGSLIRSLEGQATAVESVAFHPEGTMLAAGGLGLRGGSSLWDLRSGSLARTLAGPALEAQEMSAKEQQAAEALEDLEHVLDVAGFESTALHVEGLHRPAAGLQRLQYGMAGTRRPTVFSPDGKSLLSGSLDGFVRTWQPATGILLRAVIAHHGLVNALAFRPDGRIFATGGEDKGIEVWNAANGYLLEGIPDAHQGSVGDLAFSPDGSLLASVGGGDLKIFDATDWKPLHALHVRMNSAVTFSPDGTLVVADQDINLWDPRRGVLVRTIKAQTLGINTLAFSPDGKTIAVGTRDRTVKLFGVPSGAPLHTLPGHSGPPRSSSASSTIPACWPAFCQASSPKPRAILLSSTAASRR